MQTKHSSKAVIKRVPQTLHRCLRQLVRSLSTTCFWRNATGLFRTQIHWMSYPQRPEPTNGNMYIREGHCKIFQLTASPQKQKKMSRSKDKLSQAGEPSLSLLHQMGKLSLALFFCVDAQALPIQSARQMLALISFSYFG